MFLVILKSKELYSDRHPQSRVNVQCEYTIDTKTVTNTGLAQFMGPWYIENELHANIHANEMAKKYTNMTVDVFKLSAEYEAVNPEIKKKTVTEQGVLPA